MYISNLKNRIKYTQRGIFIPLLLVAIILLIAGSYLIQKQIERSLREEIGESLESLLKSTHQALTTWRKSHETEVMLWAENLELRNLVINLLALESDRKTLTETSIQNSLRHLFKPVLSNKKYNGFFIIDHDNLNRSSSRDANIGITNLLLAQPDILNRAWKGETVTSLPMKSEVPLQDRNGNTVENLPTMFVAAPIRNIFGAVVAILTFRIAPEDDFHPILQRGRIGDSGETYVFNKDGLMLSNSRFVTHLQMIGLLSGDQDHSDLNIWIRDPGVNLLHNHQQRPTVETNNRPLTLMAQSAINNGYGRNLIGYRDYRGVTVVGAWLWDYAWQIGITTEIDVEEAYATMHNINRFISVLSLLTVILMISIGVLFSWSQKRLKTSDRYLNTVLDNMVEGIITFNQQGIVKSFRGAAELIFGYQENEVKGHDISLLIPKDFGEQGAITKRHQILNDLVKSGSGLEITGCHKDGRTFLIEISIGEAWSDNECFYTGIVRDITQRKQVEIELEHHRQELEKLVEERSVELRKSISRRDELINATSNSIYTLDRSSYKPTYISENIKNLVGYTADEILKDEKFWLKHIHPDDLLKVKTKMSGLYKDDKIVFEYRFKNNRDEYLWIQDTTQTVKDDKGAVTDIIGSWVDVTHVKLAEAELKDQKEYLDNLLQNLSTPTFIIDPNHIVIFWNKACEELTGMPAEKVVGTNQHWRGFYRVKRPCLADVYVDQLNAHDLYMSAKESAANMGRMHAENWCTVYGGMRLYLGIDIGPIFNKQGNLVAVVENLRDLTDHRTLETELRDSRDNALEAANIKSQFLANMSHEIRTPMNGVLGMLDLIKRTRLDNEQQDFIKTAYNSAESLLEIINEILDFSKIDAGQLRIEIIQMNIYKLVSDVEKLLSYKAEEKGIRFIVSIADDVPEQVFGDPTRIRQVLINLLNNGIKFTENGSVNLSITLYKQAEDNAHIQFKIEDTGIGIPYDKQDSLFNEFNQVDASITRKFGGTGLGLTITKKILDLMGGRIRVQSEEGQGACFTLVIPVQVDHREATVTASNVVHLPTKEIHDLAHLSHIKILLVEDNKVNQKVAKGILKNLSLSADVADNGEIAVIKVIEGNYDLVLMDCQMPVMSGYEATHLIREYEITENKPRIPIIAMTANAMQGDREKCLASGMDDYLSKPVKKEILREKISQWAGDKSEHNNEVHSMSDEKNEDTPPLIDMSALDELQLIMEDEFTEVLQIYLDESISLMTDIHTGFDEESDSLLRAVHTLKSSSYNVGAKRLGFIAEKMEALIKIKDIESARSCLDELQETYAQSHTLIKKHTQKDVQAATF